MERFPQHLLSYNPDKKEPTFGKQEKMAKLKPIPIVQEDLEQFLASESDFGFEMKVLSLLRKMDFECQHSGTYQDPVTKKIRQFDLRADKAEDDRRLKLAIECKNLSLNFPFSKRILNVFTKSRLGLV